MFTIADVQLLSTLILEVEDLENAINDIDSAIILSLSTRITDSKEEQEYFKKLVHLKNIYINAKKAYEKKLIELEDKAYKDNYKFY